MFRDMFIKFYKSDFMALRIYLFSGNSLLAAKFKPLLTQNSFVPNRIWILNDFFFFFFNQ